MARNRRRVSDSVAISMDLTPWRILKLTHQGGSTGLGAESDIYGRNH